MNKFENELIIKEEKYQNGFFPKVPNVRKHGSAFILTGGCDNDIIVDDYTTARKIRQGKYTKLAEISTLPYMKEIRFNAPSEELHYSFDVYVKAVIQINDPLVFYKNRNIDVDAYFTTLFSMDVKKITREYSILEYNGLDEALTFKLSSYNTIDESTGFSYQISAVDAVPGVKAAEYVRKYGEQQLGAKLKKNARNLMGDFTTDYKEAIMTEVAEGKLTETQAILKIREYESLDYEEQIARLEALREKGFLTDREAKDYAIPTLEGIGTKSPERRLGEALRENKKIGIGAFYPGEEK